MIPRIRTEELVSIDERLDAMHGKICSNVMR